MVESNEWDEEPTIGDIEEAKKKKVEEVNEIKPPSPPPSSVVNEDTAIKSILSRIRKRTQIDVPETPPPTSLKGQVETMNQQLKDLTSVFSEPKKKGGKNKGFRLPGKITSKAKKAMKLGNMLCIYYRVNKNIDFRIVKEIGGIIELDKTLRPQEKYHINIYESNAVYRYQKYSVISVYEWRIPPIGGVVEEYHSRLIGGEEDVDLAEALKITNYAAQGIIRGIEKAEVEKGEKKKGKISPIILLVVGGIALYVLLKAFHLV